MCILKHDGCRCIFAAVFGLGASALASILAAPALPSQDNQNLPLDHVEGAKDQNPELLLRSVEVNNRPWSVISNESLYLPAHPDTASFIYGPNPLASNVPLRFRCQLDGFEQGWHERTVLMRMVIRFIDANQREIAEQVFAVMGESPGWMRRFADSPWIHRKEVFTVPADAVRFWVVISSAGPPEAVGGFAGRNLML